MGGAPEGASKILTLKHIHLRVGRAQSREATARATYSHILLARPAKWRGVDLCGLRPRGNPDGRGSRLSSIDRPRLLWSVIDPAPPLAHGMEHTASSRGGQAAAANLIGPRPWPRGDNPNRG